MKDIISDFDSLSEEKFTEYAGKWIAVIEGKIIVHGSSFKEVYEIVSKKYPEKKPLIGKLPEAGLTVLSVG